MDRQQAEEVLDVISQAWGPVDNTGYCFFPWINRREQAHSEGKKGFHTVAFEWPGERDEIIDHMLRHQNEDLYWCPVIFSEPHRQENLAQEEFSLWADLDEADPHRIEAQWKPSVAWETSPGRYQALWLLADPVEEDLYGAARAAGENRLMTHMLGADPSGWDITQLLRVPGWANHKPEYSAPGRRAQGKLLWSDGPRYTAAQFNELPPLPKGFRVVEFDEDLLAEVEAVDRREVAKRIGSSLPKRAQSLLKAKTVNGEDRSKTRWYLTQCLAEADCSVAEIIAMLRPTVWNKFEGRADELRRLGSDAVAAVDAHEEKTAGGPLPVKRRWKEGMALVKNPTWLIPGLITEGSVGFTAGEPKTRKSWIGLDLAFSVALAGQGIHAKFLNHFTVNEGGPVLYLILEDALPVAKSRGEKIWASKMVESWGVDLVDGVPHFGRDYMPSTPDPDIDFVGDCVVQLSDARGRDWLATMIGEGQAGTGRPYKMLIIDTMMRSAGDVDENRSLELMTKLLAPLTLMARKFALNIMVIHHFKKASKDGSQRGGQRMLGSQAFHAWAEDSLYITTADGNSLVIEVESKSAESSTHRFKFDGPRHSWSPIHESNLLNTVQPVDMDFAGVKQPQLRQTRNARATRHILEHGPATALQLTLALGWDPEEVDRQLSWAVRDGHLTRGRDGRYHMAQSTRTFTLTPLGQQLIDSGVNTWKAREHRAVWCVANGFNTEPLMSTRLHGGTESCITIASERGWIE